jgi:hypothetical protein
LDIVGVRYVALSASAAGEQEARVQSLCVENAYDFRLYSESKQYVNLLNLRIKHAKSQQNTQLEELLTASLDDLTATDKTRSEQRDSVVRVRATLHGKRGGCKKEKKAGNVVRLCCTFMLHVHVERLRCTFMLHVHAARSCCTFMLHVHVVRTCCTFMLYVLVEKGKRTKPKTAEAAEAAEAAETCPASTSSETAEAAEGFQAETYP